MTSQQSIGKYRVIDELGRGATGKVYLAEDPFARRKVAIKVAYPDALKNREDGAFYRNMFLNEAALAGKLQHPHIVQIYDAVVEDEYSYIVMEYVEGGTLEKFCRPESLLEPREVAEIVFKCVRALAFAHALGLTHRDIKPGNILHNDGTDIKLADFGVEAEVVAVVGRAAVAGVVPAERDAAVGPGEGIEGGVVGPVVAGVAAGGEGRLPRSPHRFDGGVQKVR